MDWQYIQLAVYLHSIFIIPNRLLVSAPIRSKPGYIVTFTSIRLLLAFAVLVVAMPQKFALSLASDQAAQQSSNDDYFLSLEGRLFGGGKQVRRDTPLGQLLREDYKTAWLQQDDYLQVEFKKFF